MKGRRTGFAVLLLLLLAAATAAGWRSIHPDTPPDPVHRLAAQLRCPACQGESVADSQSPIAAAMRQAIKEQLAQGHRPDEVRTYLVSRYGTEVLTAPPARGTGLLLWLVPVLTMAGGLAAAIRARRDGGRVRDRRPAPPAADRPTRRCRGGPPPRVGAAREVRIWNASAVCLVGLVIAVAAAAPDQSTGSTPTAATDPVPGQLALARTMEQQGRYDAAAEIYRTALAEQPTDDVRLRLAFALLRSGVPAEAEQLAKQVRADRPDDPETLLILGLAQRSAGSPEAGTTLRRFLQVDPDNPGAVQVRRLLETG